MGRETHKRGSPGPKKTFLQILQAENAKLNVIYTMTTSIHNKAAELDARMLKREGEGYN